MTNPENEDRPRVIGTCCLGLHSTLDIGICKLECPRLLMRLWDRRHSAVNSLWVGEENVHPRVYL